MFLILHFLKPVCRVVAAGFLGHSIQRRLSLLAAERETSLGQYTVAGSIMSAEQATDLQANSFIICSNSRRA
jgi:hypothetical protein